MATPGMIGYNTAFQIGNGAGTEVFTAVADVIDIVPPGMSRDAVETTTLTSANRYREYIPGLFDAGEVELELAFVPAGATHTILLAEAAKTTVTNYKIVYPDAGALSFSGFCTAMSPASPLEDRMTIKMTYKVTGKPTYA